jgi:hypothetical protein
MVDIAEEPPRQYLLVLRASHQMVHIWAKYTPPTMFYTTHFSIFWTFTPPALFGTTQMVYNTPPSVSTDGVKRTATLNLN